MRKYSSLMSRTCEIIRRGGLIFLKRADGYYLHHHTNIAAAFDAAVWGQRTCALEIDTLELAFLLAPYFECKVVVYCPRGKKR